MMNKGYTKALTIPVLTASDIKRFEKKIEIDKKGCYRWLGFKNPAGYGQFWLQGRDYMAHRVSYFMSNGSISDDLVIDHLCAVRDCVNPEHLEEVTFEENWRRVRVPLEDNPYKRRVVGVEIPLPTQIEQKRFFNKIIWFNGCLIFTGALKKDGYGVFSINKKTYMAHRVSYMLAYGYIDPIKVVDHLCRRRNCVNPKHLEAISQKENIRRRDMARDKTKNWSY